jgi:GrpB-like predicted nucleotidyltransferase (UPF0157 family)
VPVSLALVAKGRSMSHRKIEVLNYDPDWAIDFDIEQALLNEAIGPVALNIEHIGSTSVNGLVAKPIIDIMIEVSNLKSLDKSSEKLASIGYEIKGENGIEGRRYFQKGGNQRTHHVHAFLTGDKNLKRHIAFREYLIAHPEISEEYGAIKKQAANSCENNSVLYMSMKNEFIQKHEPLAVRWYGN